MSTGTESAKADAPESGADAPAPALQARARRRPGENREQLIAAALYEFARNGYRVTSTLSVATRAGVPQPHLYASFRSKRELYEVCADLVRARVCEAPYGATRVGAAPVSTSLPVHGASAEFDGGVVGAFLLQAVAGAGDGETGQISRELLDAIEEHHGAHELAAAIQRGFTYLRSLPAPSA